MRSRKRRRWGQWAVGRLLQEYDQPGAAGVGEKRIQVAGGVAVRPAWSGPQRYREVVGVRRIQSGGEVDDLRCSVELVVSADSVG